MANESVIKNLAKVMVAAAWADGEINNDEINSLKDLLFHLPGMNAQDWAEIEIYVDSPVGEAERQRLVNQLQNSLQSSADKALAIQALDSLADNGGTSGPQELAEIEQIKAAIQESGAGSSKLWGRFTRSRVENRRQEVDHAPNREQFMDDFVKNKVYYSLRRRLASENMDSVISEAQLRKLSLAGGLLARVAYTDRQVSEAERGAIEQALSQNWGISTEEAALTAEVAVSEISKGLDYYRLTREFFECTTEQERVRFLDALFAVTAGDGRASNAEMEEIRTISNGLLLTHQQFIDSKLKLPREQRAN